MDSDAFLDHEYENLNDAILKAIVASTEVKDILARFKKLNQMNNKAVLNLKSRIILSTAVIDQNHNLTHP